MNEDDHSPTRVVFLFDVDNTLVDNDRVAADLQRHLASEIGAEGAQEYWRIFEQLRTELGYADYLGALQRYRAKHPRALHLLCVSDFLINYPFAERLFPDALKVIEHVLQWGPAVILSDGDVVFQPLKDQPLRIGQCSLRARGDLRAQGAGTRRCRATLPGRTLRARGRQIAYPGRGEKILGLACDHYFR